MRSMIKMVLVFFLLGCIAISGCTSDKSAETVSTTEAVVEAVESVAETTQLVETADPELQTGFVEIVPEEEESVPQTKSAEDKKNNVPEETVPPSTEAKKEDPDAVHVPNMGDLVP